MTRQPSAEERKAAKSRWVQRVDAACHKANEAIAERGWPMNLVDLDRLVVRGIEDAQNAIREIGDTPLPEGAGRQPGAFVRELKALEPELGKLDAASEDLEPAALVRAAEALKPRLATIEQAAEDAGLSDCLTHDERFFVPDAVRAPVFAEQLNKLDRSLLRRMKRIDFADAGTPGEFAAAFAGYSEIIDTAQKGIDALDPPQWAAEQVGNYAKALRDLQSETQEFTALLVQDKGKAPQRARPLEVHGGAEGAQRRGRRGDQDAPQDAARGRRGADRPAARRGRARRARRRADQLNGARAAAG